MRYVIAFLFLVMPSVAFAQNLTDEDIEAITDSITVRALQMQSAAEDDEQRSDVIDKIDQILANQHEFQAFVRVYVEQELRKKALRAVLGEFRGASVQTASYGGCRTRGFFRMRGRF